MPLLVSFRKVADVNLIPSGLIRNGHDKPAVGRKLAAALVEGGLQKRNGFAADSEINWVKPGVVSALVAAGHMVVAADARGHGQSDKPHDSAAYDGDVLERDAQAVIDHFGFDEVLATYFEPLGVPVAFGFPVGHIDDQWTLPLGVRARLDAGAGELDLLEAAVA